MTSKIHSTRIIVYFDRFLYMLCLTSFGYLNNSFDIISTFLFVIDFKAPPINLLRFWQESRSANTTVRFSFAPSKELLN